MSGSVLLFDGGVSKLENKSLSQLGTCAKLLCGKFFGGLGEWLNPPDCKSGARKGYVGSNPTPSTLWTLKLIPKPHEPT